MSAANGRMTMAWVWPALVLLARLGTAQEPRRDAHGALDGSEALFSDSEPPTETRSGGGFLPVPAWKFVKDAADASDLGRPQFLCSHTSLSVRLSLIRHSDLRLQDGSRLAWLQQGCGGSVGTVGPWLLLKLPYNCCHVASQVSNGTRFHRLKLRYSDHLLRENMTAVVACGDPATWTLPEVSCRSTEVAVKLPLGSRLQKVKAVGKDVAVGRVQTSTAPGPVLVHVSTPADEDSVFEVIYVDSAGETSTMLVACLSAARGDGRDRQRRALQHQDQWDWGGNPRHWGSVEPRQMADNSSEYLHASDDETSAEESEDEEEPDEDYDSDEESDEDEASDEEPDDADTTAANMTDAQTNSTTAAPTAAVEAEGTSNTSMLVKPRLGRGLNEPEMSGESELMDMFDYEDEDYGLEDDHMFDAEMDSLAFKPRLWRGMDSSDEPEDLEEDEEDEDDDGSGSEDDDYTSSPLNPKMWRGMEVSDEPEEDEDDSGSESEDEFSDDEDSDDDSTATNTTEIPTISIVAATSEDLNTSNPAGPRLWRGMEDLETSGEPEDMDEDEDQEEDDGSLALNPRLGGRMEDMETSGEPEEDDDGSGSGSDSEDDDYTSPSAGPRLWRRIDSSEDQEEDDDFLAWNPRLGGRMEDPGSSEEDSDDDYDSEDEYNLDEDSETNVTEALNTTAGDALVAEPALNTSKLAGPRVWRRMEDMEDMEEDEDMEDMDEEEDVFLPLRRRLMEEMDHMGSDDEDDDSDDDMPSPLGPRLGRGDEDMSSSDVEDDSSEDDYDSEDEDSEDEDDSTTAQMNTTSAAPTTSSL